MTRAIYRQKTRFKTFTPGKILGQVAIDESKTQNLTWLLNQHHDAQYRFDNHSWHFFADAVNLQDYGDVGGLNFKDWLEQKVQQAQNEGRKLKILEIGIAHGFQWHEFLKKHADHIELHGTTMERYPMKVPLKTLTRGHAGQIAKQIRQKFDVVIARQTFYTQPNLGIEVGLHLTKKGGTFIRAPITQDDATELQHKLKANCELTFHPHPNQKTVGVLEITKK